MNEGERGENEVKDKKKMMFDEEDENETEENDDKNNVKRVYRE